MFLLKTSFYNMILRGSSFQNYFDEIFTKKCSFLWRWSIQLQSSLKYLALYGQLPSNFCKTYGDGGIYQGDRMLSIKGLMESEELFVFNCITELNNT